MRPGTLAAAPLADAPRVRLVFWHRPRFVAGYFSLWASPMSISRAEFFQKGPSIFSIFPSLLSLWLFRKRDTECFSC